MQVAFVQLLQTPGALEVMLDSNTNDIDEFSHHLFSLSEMLHLTRDTLVALAKYEIRKRGSEIHLFRIDSVPTKCFSRFNKSVGRDYVHTFLTTFVKYCQKRITNKLDLDAVNADDPSIRNVARRKVATAFQFLLTVLVGTSYLVPADLKMVCTMIASNVENKFGKASRRTFLVGYFFVRFLCPALVVPPSTIEVNQTQRKLNIMLSKMLQAGASGQPFESDNMKFANKFIAEARDMVDLFLLELCSEPLTENQKKIQSDCRFELTKLKLRPSKQERKRNGVDDEVLSREETVEYFTEYFNEKFDEMKERSEKDMVEEISFTDGSPKSVISSSSSTSPKSNGNEQDNQAQQSSPKVKLLKRRKSFSLDRRIEIEDEERMKEKRSERRERKKKRKKGKEMEREEKEEKETEKPKRRTSVLELEKEKEGRIEALTEFRNGLSDPSTEFSPVSSFFFKNISEGSAYPISDFDELSSENLSQGGDFPPGLNRRARSLSTEVQNAFTEYPLDNSKLCQSSLSRESNEDFLKFEAHDSHELKYRHSTNEIKTKKKKFRGLSSQKSLFSSNLPEGSSSMREQSRSSPMSQGTYSSSHPSLPFGLAEAGAGAKPSDTTSEASFFSDLEPSAMSLNIVKTKKPGAISKLKHTISGASHLDPPPSPPPFSPKDLDVLLRYLVSLFPDYLMAIDNFFASFAQIIDQELFYEAIVKMIDEDELLSNTSESSSSPSSSSSSPSPSSSSSPSLPPSPRSKKSPREIDFENSAALYYFLSHWIEQYCLHYENHCPTFLSKLKELATRLSTLQKSIDTRRNTKARKFTSRTATFVPAAMQLLPSKTTTKSSESLSFCPWLFEKFDVETICGTLGYVMNRTYLSVGPPEFFDGAWQGKQRHNTAPGLTKLSHLFNYLSFLCTVEVLFHDREADREIAIRRCIELATLLRKKGNLEGMAAVVSMFDSTSVHRLRSIWKSNKKLSKILKAMRNLLKPENGYREYWKYASSQPIFVPFFAPKLCELRRTYERESKLNSDGSVNYPVLNKTGEMINEQLQYKTTEVVLPVRTDLVALFLSPPLLDLDSVEDVLYERSLQVMPLMVSLEI